MAAQVTGEDGQETSGHSPRGSRGVTSVSTPEPRQQVDGENGEIASGVDHGQPTGRAVEETPPFRHPAKGGGDGSQNPQSDQASTRTSGGRSTDQVEETG